MMINKCEGIVMHIKIVKQNGQHFNVTCSSTKLMREVLRRATLEDKVYFINQKGQILEC